MIFISVKSVSGSSGNQADSLHCVPFVSFFTLGRSFLSPLPFITAHGLSIRSARSLVFFRFCVAPLRYAFFKVKKNHLSQFFSGCSFSVRYRPNGLPTADFFIFGGSLRGVGSGVPHYAPPLVWLLFVVVPPPTFPPHCLTTFTATTATPKKKKCHLRKLRMTFFFFVVCVVNPPTLLRCRFFCPLRKLRSQKKTSSAFFQLLRNFRLFTKRLKVSGLV